MWPLLVVVADIDAEDTFELAAAEDEQPSRHSRRALPTQRSMWAFALGALNGVLITFIRSPWKTASKARLNFASRSWIRNRGRWP